MTVLEALRAIDPREARILLCAASGLPHASLVASPERELSKDCEERFSGFLSRRRSGEPIAYILGRKEFYGLELEVTPDVLIPRPETELLVELALERRFSSAVDLGTGSGALALAIKKHRPEAKVIAVDASPPSLAVAKRNAGILGLEIDFREGRWCEPLAGERFDLVVANPPYVAEGDPHLAALAFEPVQALVSGPQGLDDLRHLAGAAPAHLAQGGWLLLEHGFDQASAVRELLAQAGLEEVATWPDLSGIPRVTGGRR